MRNFLIALPLLVGGCLTAAARFAPSSIDSAKIEQIEVDAGKSAIRVNIRNTGELPITAFSILFYQVKSSGERVPCGGRGADMIDWSDPMPRSNVYIHMRRNWIEPHASQWFEGYPRYRGETVPLDNIRAELSFIMFDDGGGEGDPARINFILLTRQQARDERVKWMARFAALHHTSALKSSSQQLYQDLVDAAHEAEINPERASQQGSAKPVRNELQGLALDITQWASRGDDLTKNEVLDWRVTDLEQRTVRLIQGAGKMDASPL